jgi:chromosome segregation ATPase
MSDENEKIEALKAAFEGVQAQLGDLNQQVQGSRQSIAEFQRVLTGHGEYVVRVDGIITNLDQRLTDMAHRLDPDEVRRLLTEYGEANAKFKQLMADFEKRNDEVLCKKVEALSTQVLRFVDIGKRLEVIEKSAKNSAEVLAALLGTVDMIQRWMGRVESEKVKKAEKKAEKVPEKAPEKPVEG